MLIFNKNINNFIIIQTVKETIILKTLIHNNIKSQNYNYENIRIST